MTKVAKDLANIAQNLYENGSKKEAWAIFHVAQRLVEEFNSIVESDPQPKQSNGSEIWMEWNPELKKLESSNNLQAHPCQSGGQCACGGACR